MHSCVYLGNLHHHRYQPRPNSFTYKVFYMFLDISELPHLFTSHWLWSVEQANLATFKRADYFGSAAIPLDQAVRNRVEQVLGKRPEGPIRMLTHLRYFGHCFNPVSFYYCYNAEDTGVEAIMAEITNTPWRERHSYVLSEEQNRTAGPRKQFLFAKEFHVSPFMDMEFTYEWNFVEPTDSLNIHLRNIKHDRLFFEAKLDLQRHEISGPILAWILIRFPAMTLRILAMIYWQAFGLWRKNTPYYEHLPKR